MVLGDVWVPSTQETIWTVIINAGTHIYPKRISYVDHGLVICYGCPMGDALPEKHRRMHTYRDLPPTCLT